MLLRDMGINHSNWFPDKFNDRKSDKLPMLVGISPVILLLEKSKKVASTYDMPNYITSIFLVSRIDNISDGPQVSPSQYTLTANP
jgi:hypothetical protein